MIISLRKLIMALGLAGSMILAACGDDTETATASNDAVAEEDAGGDEQAEDHDDEDHDDEDHDDEDHDDHEGEALGAHEHGTAEVDIALFDNEVSIELVTPTFNLFGFEYEATTDEDAATVDERTAALTADGVLVINESAGCSPAVPAATELEYEGSHAEMTATWVFICDNPDKIEQLDATTLFAEFPNFEDVDVQWLSDTEQSAAELSPSSPVLDFT